MFSWWTCLENIKVDELRELQIVWNKEPWLPHVYAKTQSISLPGFIPKVNMRCTQGDQSLL